MIATAAMSFGRIAACLLLLSGFARVSSAEMVNRIVATVDGDPITAHEVKRYGEERRAHGVGWDALLEAVITDKILEKEIVSRKITAKREDVDRYVADVMERNKMTEDQFKTALKQQNLTLEQYRAKIKVEIERTQLVGRELGGAPTPAVTDEDVRRYYDEHKTQFSERTGVTVSDIFFAFQKDMTRQDAIRVMEQAKAVKQMADAGQSFDALARRYSQGPGAELGGRLGSFKRGEMAPELERVIFMIPAGEVSPPIPAGNGIHLFRVDAEQTGGHVEFDTVKDEIRQRLASEAMDQRFRDWIAKNLRERHHVEVLN